MTYIRNIRIFDCQRKSLQLSKSRIKSDINLMKKTLLKFSKSLLSTEETKTIKGGYDTGGGPGSGEFNYIICANYAVYPPDTWYGYAGPCPTEAYAISFCQNQGMGYIRKTC